MPRPVRTVLVASSPPDRVEDYANLLGHDTAFSYRVVEESNPQRVVAICQSQWIAGIILELPDCPGPAF
ncbi:MAG: hypothetical protein HC922_04825 [Leptolyngbyaceae cyanobacterium SM2_3_12]|nr:hypothetical protein [Leptolyngbyaceae cyanobacterium SM2_3_12]